MPAIRTLRLLFSFCLFLVLVPLTTAHAGSRIGLYTDASGSTCSFSGNAQGIVTAYVVIHPDPNGVQAVRFAAPVPPCLNATFLGDSAPDGETVIGSSPTGVQVAFPFCAPYGEPSLVLTITYFRSGSTVPCCAFPVVADPSVGSIEATDCSFHTGTMTSVISHFNADGSCPCADPTPPGPPVNPGPADGAANVSLTAPLTWGPSPLDIDIATYDVYLGTTATPVLVANVTQGFYQPAQYFNPSTTYFWRVVVNDTDGNATQGPLWMFTTVTSNSSPNAPVPTAPLNGATVVAVNQALQWTASDPNNDPLKYDVYLGPGPSPVLVASNHTQMMYSPATLAFDTDYSWYIVARDALGAETTGPTSTFTTRLENYPPLVPTLPSPVDGATFQPTHLTLQWTGGDPDNNLSTYLLYVGTSNPPPLHGSGTGSITTIDFAAGTQLYWYVVARDSYGATATSPVWTFRTNAIPTAPANPSPAFQAVNQPLNTTLAWQSTDADGEQLKFDVYAGNSTTPPLRASNVTSPSFDVSHLTALNQDFFWTIVAKDNHGAAVTGPLWYFHTMSQATAVPDLPTTLTLGRNHPNPFNPQTIIPYTVPRGASLDVRITIFDATGRPVRVLVNETQAAGAREVVWRGDNDDGTVVSSGIYYCVLDAGGRRFTQKLVLLK